tara:strand:- start:54 stop:332 length:279 start_codon:yes stop_codon:yes gene_type:complete
LPWLELDSPESVERSSSTVLISELSPGEGALESEVAKSPRRSSSGSPASGVEGGEAVTGAVSDWETEGVSGGVVLSAFSIVPPHEGHLPHFS